MNSPTVSPAEEAHQELKSRFSNPIVSAFAISWALWNWKPLVVLFLGEEKPSARIAEAVVYFGWGRGFWAPLATASLFLFVISPVGGMLPRIITILWAKLNARIENWQAQEQNRILDSRIESWVKDTPKGMEEWASTLQEREKKVREETAWCEKRRRELEIQKGEVDGLVAVGKRLKQDAERAQIDLVMRIAREITGDPVFRTIAGSAKAESMYKELTSDAGLAKLVKRV
ncbi:MAG: hypothetical protein J0M24_06705 [Verrucomicrobia bacterium]|nr:hypothetical protein [Verrucomicrobiota bacterium]